MGAIDTAFGRRSLENINVPLTGHNLVKYLQGGSTAASGVAVNRQTVLGLAGVWRALNLISNSVASLNVHVLRLEDDGRRKIRDVRHPAYPRLRYQADPDDFVSAETFFRNMTALAVLEGAAYAQIARDNAASPRRLIMLDAANTFPVRVTDEATGRRALYYWVRFVDVDQRFREDYLPAEDVLCVKGIGFDGLTAVKLIDHLKDAFGQGIAVQRYGGRFFVNGDSGRYYVSLPYRFKSPKVAEDFAKRFEEKYAGLHNAHRPPIMDNGGEIKMLGMSNEDSQFLQTGKFHLVTLANIFNLPSALLGDEAKTSFASLEQEHASLLLHSINPWLEQWEGEMWQKLLLEREKESMSHTIAFERKGWLAADLKGRSEFYKMMIGAQAMVPNEPREIEGLNPVPWGDEPIPLPNESPSGSAASADDEASRDAAPQYADELAEASGDELKRQAQSLMRRLGHALRRAAKKPQGFTDWISEHLEADHYAFALDNLAGPVRLYQLSRGAAINPTREVLETLFLELREELTAISERATYETLAEQVERVALEYESEGAERIVSRVGHCHSGLSVIPSHN